MYYNKHLLCISRAAENGRIKKSRQDLTALFSYN